MKLRRSRPALDPEEDQMGADEEPDVSADDSTDPLDGGSEETDGSKPFWRRGAKATDLPVNPAVLDADPVMLTSIERVYGFLVAAELIFVAILNLVITHGKGAPKHPDTTLAVIALASAVVFIGVLQLRKRTTTAFAAIISAFFITLPKVPDSLGLYHLFALAIPAAYGLVLAQRRRKGEKARIRAGVSPASDRSDRAAGGRADRSGRGARPGRDRRAQPTGRTGPGANRRYTPPKPKKRSTGRT